MKTTPDITIHRKNRPTRCRLSSTMSPPFLFSPNIGYFFPSIAFSQALMMSTGNGKTIVVFFSTPISVSVCK